MKVRKYAVVLISVLCLLSGCTVGDKEVVFSFTGPFTVFSIGPLSCKKTEAKVYLVNYNNIYGQLGKTDLWEGRFDTQKVEKGIKGAVIDHLSKIYSLNLYAREKDISLDEEEKTLTVQAAKEYYNSLTDMEKRETGAHLRDIRKMYEHYVLAEKVYHKLMNSVDEEVSEDEARIMDAYVLFVRDAKLARKMAVQIKNGATFERLVSSYSQGEKGIVSFGRGDYPQKVEDEAFALKDTEISKMIKTQEGYYFVQCVNKYNEELSEANKKRIIEGRKEAVIKKIREQQTKKYDSQINTKMWNRMTIVPGKELKTDSFFVTIDSYLPGS